MREGFTLERPPVPAEAVVNNAEQELWQGEIDDSAFSVSDRIEQISQHTLMQGQRYLDFEGCLAHLPADAVAPYLMRMEAALVLAAKQEAGGVAQVDAVLFELSRIVLIKGQGLEELDFSTHIAEPITYDAYPSGAKEFTPQNRSISRTAAIGLDVPIVRSGVGVESSGEKLPYIYEVKAYPRRVYGAAAGDRNQILKYQKAIEDGVAAGATVEIRGRIDAEFLQWLVGGSIIDKGAAPDVEVIYSMNLPSGAEYRFVLNGGARRGLQFQNQEAVYTRQDHEVINGIFESVIDRSVVKILAGNDVSEPSAELQPLLDDPFQNIKSAALLEEFSSVRLGAMYAAFQSKNTAAKVNDHNELSSVEIFEHTSDDERYTAAAHVFDALQERLMHDPEMAGMRERYKVTDKEVKKRDRIILESLEMIGRIADFETSRAQAEAGQGVNRPGYQGRPEGVALPVNSIVFDAVYNVIRIEQGVDAKVLRSYESTDKFATITPATIAEYLRDQERDYLTFDLYDPETDMLDTISGDGSQVTRRIIEKQKIKFPLENEKRLNSVFLAKEQAHRERQTRLLEKSDKTPQEERELRHLQAVSITLLQRHTNIADSISRRREATQALNDEKAEVDKKIKHATPEEVLVLRAQLQEIVGRIKVMSEETRVLNARDKQRLLEVKKDFIGPDEWKKHEIRVIKDAEQHLIKFIYIITADGTAVLCEETMKGTARMRATHSEVARGRNVYGAGEIVFEKKDDQWVAVEINNATGHYKTSRLTLPYAAHVLGQDIDLSDCSLRDTGNMRGVATPSFCAALPE